MTPPKISFEFFPPKNLKASFRLWDTVQVLAPLEPRFISVTYGAGGTTRGPTRDAVSTLHKSSGLRVAAHLTCVNSSRQETLAVADSFAATGISDIIALRGDPPKGVTNFTPHPDGFQNSIELITVLAQSGTFTLRVAAYPEGHPEAESISADIAFLKRKIDAGASEALTQFFFSRPKHFCDFATLATRLGLRFRSRPVFCRLKTGRARGALPKHVMPTCRLGSATRSQKPSATAAKTSWQLQSVPNYVHNCWMKVWICCISTH